MMLKWARGFVAGILLGIVALEGGVIVVQDAIIGGYWDGLKNVRRRSIDSIIKKGDDQK